MGKRSAFLDFYDTKYKKLLMISFVILALSIAIIGYKLATTGDFIDKGISLKGGITLTVLTEEAIDAGTLRDSLLLDLPNSDINIRKTSEFGTQKSIIIDASDTSAEELIVVVQQYVPAANTKLNVNIDSTDAVLGTLSFYQTMKAVFIAFLFMAIVVFLYFGDKLLIKIIAGSLTIAASFMVLSSDSTVLLMISFAIAAVLLYLYSKYSIPSVAVILAAFSDIIFTVAVLNLLEIKLTLAGIAAFLMLIGYSVDTDILMSVRVLKRKEGSVFSRIVGASKTGLTMSAAALAVVISALLISQSETIIQIMTVLLIGLTGDIMFTWIQNAGILRWYLEARGKK